MPDEPPRPFSIHVEDAVLDDLKERLERTRSNPPFHSKGRDYGQNEALQNSLLNHWLTAYDWRKHERELNAFKQFKLKVQGLDVHFIHERSRVPGAIPILLVHGWPGSVWEFHNVIPLLANPTGRALRLKQAFHVVAPSLPGYGWSEALSEPGMNYDKVANMFQEIMRKLGYDKYYAQGGDWGAMITKQMAFKFPSNCIALHQNMPFAEPVTPPNDLRTAVAFVQAVVDMSPLGKLSLSQSERESLARLREFQAADSAYMALHASKPHTLGFALSDSPAGLLAWVSEKYQSWTDGKGNVLNALSKDDLITNVMIYWVTNSITSSMRFYYESIPNRGKRAQDRVDSLTRPGYIEVPTGVAYFPKEIMRLPRRWVAMHYNVVHFTEFAEGGHFAAWEQPELFVQDLRTFAFRSMPFEKACQLADERELRKKVKPPTNTDLATNLLMFAPALPIPAVAALATYLLSSKL